MADTHVCPSCGSERPASGPPGPCITCLTQWGSDHPPGHRPGTEERGVPDLGSGGSNRFDPTRGFDPQANLAGGRSVLATIAEAVGGDVPHVLLRDTDSGPPVARPGSAEVPKRQEPGARFQIVGEIARGGMGAILRGRDVDLGRDLAVKVLLASHRRKPGLVRRFVEEAQISGQLQHPGIIPVYDMGTFADRRPYFTMKLVKGSTLAALLAERPDPRHEQAKLLKVFEQVCQTVGYAHARGVIHRDLKPSNVMVGSFGEVQVMDWGLAKVLEAGGVADERGRSERSRPAETVIHTLRSGSGGDSDASHAGSLMGTPAYMPPEQALGQVEAMDRRSDVFGLGAILCEILTGTPPYGPGSSEEVVRRALRGDVADAVERLEACGADAGLVALTRECLTPEPKDRPRDAGVVAARVTAHLEGVQERLRQSELDKVRAQARAARMKTMVTAAASLVILLIGGGTTGYVLDRQARDRDARFAQTLAVAEGLRGRIVEASRQRVVRPSEWNEVLAAVESAERLMPGSAPAALRDRARSLEAAVRADRAAAETDRQLLAALAEARVAQQDLGLDGTDAAFVAALGQARLDLDRLAPDEAAARLKARPPTVAAELAPFLDALADLRRKQKAPPKGWGHLLAAAKAADPDAYRVRLRTLVEAEDLKPVLSQLRALARDEHAAALPPASVVLLFSALQRAGDETAADDVLRRAAAVHPDDLWLNFILAQQSPPAEALRYFTAARAIRPETAHELAHQLEKLGRQDEALPVFKDLVRRVPDNARHLGCYGVALMKAGQRDEGRATIDRAVALARRRVAERPGESQGYITVGFCLDKAGELAPATEAYLDGLRHTPPDDTGTYPNLMHTIARFEDADAAIEAYFQALRLRPARPEAAKALVELLEQADRRDEALPLARRAVGGEPGAAPAYGQLGFALKDKRWLDESNAAFHEAIRLDPSYHAAHVGLGWNLLDRGDTEGAVAALREGVRLKPDFAQAHASLGEALQRLGRDDEGVESLLRAVSLGFDQPSALGALFVSLERGGRTGEVLDRARRTFPTQPPQRAAAYRALGTMLTDHGRLEQGILAYQESDRPFAGDLMTLARMGLAHFATGDLAQAANAYQRVAGGRTDRVPSAQTFVELARQGAAVHDWGAEMLLSDAESNPHREYARGLIQLTFGRSPKAYADTARVALDRYGQSQQANAVDHVARLFGLAPQSPADAARAVGLTERGGTPAEAGGGRPVRDYIAGLAQYRAGNHREAIRRCGESLAHQPPWPAAALNRPVTAMAYHALGEAASAATWLDAAERGSVDTADNWHDGVELALLRSEARSLIRGTTPPHELEVVSPAAMTEFYLLRLGRPDRVAGLLRDTIRLRPTDAQAHAHLGMALAAKGERVEAEAAFAEAARLAGDGLAAHVGLADAYARLGHWSRAAAALERADALEPTFHWHLYRAAPLYLAAGDTAGYRRTCESLRARFGDAADDPMVAERLAKALLLDAGASPDVPAAIRLADRAVTDSDENKFVWYFQLAKALAEYRAGRDAAAVEWVRRMPEWSDNASGTVVREAVAAMAHHRLGRAPEARAALAAARLRAVDGPSLALHRTYAVDWHDWLIAELLLREAETQLGAGQ